MNSLSSSPQKHNEKNYGENFPGVGAYNITTEFNSKLHRSPVSIIGKAKKQKTQSNRNPSPGDYDLAKYSLFTAKHKKGFTMLGKRRQRINSEGSDPSQYSLNLFPQKISHAYSMGKKLNNKEPNEKRPGPAHYTPISKQSINFVFSKSERPSIELASKNYPSPTSYDNIKKNSNEKKFSFSQRQKFYQQNLERQKKQEIPAPNSYIPNYNQVKKNIASSKFIKSKRQVTSAQENNPGVGEYNIGIKNKGSVAVIGNNSFSLQKINSNPGPGKYQIFNVEKIKRNFPSVKFEKCEKNKGKKLIDIGPGSYNIQNSPSNKAYSIGQKRNTKEKIFKSPGPQSYNPKFQIQFRKTQALIMGKSKRIKDNEQKKQSAGPGHYFTETQQKCKTFYFPKQVKKQKISKNPGPGAYILI